MSYHCVCCPNLIPHAEEPDEMCDECLNELLDGYIERQEQQQ